ncbi:MAG: DUF1846 family protein [Alphaproteobacteria bacterium]|nr:DUF1846 family protein [Alphaproteobacteria bacterium]
METNHPAFNIDLYLEKQISAIKGRLADKSFDRLVIEVGGKLIDDNHAVRCLPGYKKDLKFEILNSLFPDARYVCAVSANDIINKTVRKDMHIDYAAEVFRLVDGLKQCGKNIGDVIIMRVRETQRPLLDDFCSRLDSSHISYHMIPECENYSPGVGLIEHLDGNLPLSGGKEDNTTIVFAPGAGSGKFGVCLASIYLALKSGLVPFYMKMETFPVWNLPIDHPVNKAYEAATLDVIGITRDNGEINIGDHIEIDSGFKDGDAISYNRDLENFKLLKYVSSMFDNGVLLSEYESATSMGVNCIADGIIDDAAIRAAGQKEIARRHKENHCTDNISI